MTMSSEKIRIKNLCHVKTPETVTIKTRSGKQYLVEFIVHVRRVHELGAFKPKSDMKLQRHEFTGCLIKCN